MPIGAVTALAGLDSLAGAAPVGIWRSTRGRGNTWVNDRFLELTGLTRLRALGSGWLDAVHPDDRPRVEALARDIRQDPRERSLEYRIVHPDHGERVVRVQVAPFDLGGEDDGFVGVMEDVTEHHSAEREAVRLRALCEQSSDFVGIAGPDGRFLYLNQAARDVLGIPPGEDITQLLASTFFAPGTPPEVFDAMARDLDERGTWSGEVTLRALDGRETVVSQVAMCHRDEQGRVECYSSVSRDISPVKVVEEELRRKEAWYRAIVDGSSDLVAVVGADERVRYTGPRLQALLGYQDHEAVGVRFRVNIHPDDFDRVGEAFRAVVREGGVSPPVVYRARRADGAEVLLESIMTNRLDDPDVAGVVLNTRDVSERERIGAALRESEERFRSLAESSPLGIVYSDATANVVYVNERWAEICGVPAAELLGPSDWRMAHPDDRERAARETMEALVAGEEFRGEFRVVRPDGTVRRIRTLVSQITDEVGRVSGFVAMSEDITEEHEARARAARFATLLAATPDFSGITARGGRLVYLNPGARRLFGVDPETDVEGMLARDVVVYTPESRAKLDAELWPALERDGVWNGDLEFVLPDGSTLPVSQLVVAHHDDDGRIEYLSTVARDISELKEVEARVARSEAWFRSLVQHAMDIVTVRDADLRLRFVSPAFERLFGLSADSVRNLEQYALVHPDDVEAVQAAYEVALRQPGGTARVEYRAHDHEGRWLTLDAHITNLLDDPIVAGVVTNTRDITERRVAEDARSRSQQALRAVVESSPLAIFAVDEDGIVQLWNPASEELFGWSADEAVGRPPQFVPADRMHEFDAWRTRVFAGETVRNLDFERVHRDGHSLFVNLSVAPVRDASGRVVTAIAVAADISGRREMEEALRAHSAADSLVAAVSQRLLVATPEELDDVILGSLVEAARFLGADGTALFTVEHDDALRCAHKWSEDGLPPLSAGVVAPESLGPFQAGLGDAGYLLVEASKLDGPELEHFRRFGADMVVAFPARRGGQIVGSFVFYWRRGEAPVSSAHLEPLTMLGGALVSALDRRRAEQSLRDSEEWYRHLAEHASDFVLVYGQDNRISYLSPQAQRFAGLTVGGPISLETSIVHPEDQQLVIERVGEVVAAGTAASSRPFEARIRRADGAYRWLELIATNLLDTPAVGGIVINARDVTEHREATHAMAEINDALMATNATLNAVIQNSPLAIFAVDNAGHVTMWNPACERTYGWTMTEVIGGPPPAMSSEDRSEVALLRTGLTAGATTGNREAKRRTRDGRTIDVIHSSAPLTDKHGRVTGVLDVSTDISDRVAAEQALRASEERFRALVQNASDVVTVVDEDMRLIYTSPAAERLFGFEPGDDSWTDPLNRVHPDDAERVMEAMGAQMEGRSNDLVQFRLQVADGSWRVVESFAQDLTQDPAVGGIVVTTRDVTERAKAEDLVADQAAILRLVAQGAPLEETLATICRVVEAQVPGVLCSVMLHDEATGTLRNGAGPSLPAAWLQAIDGVQAGPNVGSCGTAVHERQAVVTADVSVDDRWRPWADAALAHGLRACWSTPIFASSGERVLGTFGVYGTEPRQPDAAEERVVGMVTHLAAIAIERKEFEDQLAHQAHHDPLTGLPNRTLFLEFLTLALARARRNHTAVAVLFLDLDRFKVVNDSLGHDAGDTLLTHLAERLRPIVRPGDTIARFGGDEFTVLCEGLDPASASEQASEVAARLLEAVERPFVLGAEVAHLNTSIGIAVATPTDRPEDLLRDADAAMYRAKERGKGRWELFDEAMRSDALARLETESALHRALEHGQLRVYFQPIVDLGTGRCAGAEALLRWQHPDRGLVPPDMFIDLAEETGLILPIGTWLIEEVCAQIARWRDEGCRLDPGFSVCVNFSARQMAQRGLVDHLASTLHRSQVAPEMISVEITERVLMADQSTEAVHQLKELGLGISIDDFGTGYSSLGYLKRFPVDFVKIDRSFVDGLGTDPEDSAIVTAVLSLGHALGHSVVAEGVETEHQLAELMRLGCDQAQGYWFSPARPASEVGAMLRAPRVWALPNLARSAVR